MQPNQGTSWKSQLLENATTIFGEDAIAADGKEPIRELHERSASSRSSVYYTLRAVSERDLKLRRRLDELHLMAPFYGAR